MKPLNLVHGPVGIVGIVTSLRLGLKGQITGLQNRRIREQQSSLQYIANLANISWPVVGAQTLDRLRRQFGPRARHIGTNPYQQGLRDVGNVVRPLAQWWNCDGHSANSEIKIATKGLRLDHVPQILMG